MNYAVAFRVALVISSLTELQGDRIIVANLPLSNASLSGLRRGRIAPAKFQDQPLASGGRARFTVHLDASRSGSVLLRTTVNLSDLSSFFH